MNENTNIEAVETTATEEKVEGKETAAAKEETAPRMFTQAELDEIITKRLARVKQPETKETDNAKLTELQDALNAQYKKVMKYETEKIAGTLNFKPERLEAVLKLADLSDIKINKNGEFSSDDIKAKLEKVAADFPEFVTEVKEIKEENKGFIKAGVETSEIDKQEEILNQIRKGFGLK